MWSDELMFILTVMNIYFSKSYYIFPAGFFPLIYLMDLMQSSFWFIGANGFSAIFFWTVPGIDVVKKDKPFLQDWVV